ncbi:MAG TPA: phosphate butyryltransferase [Candidatus Cloacimonetes bacterium]|nr:phosphate butyryltransferase [Candidatus Cloacimonadota bacterium]
MAINKLDDIIELAKKRLKNKSKKRVVVAYAHDENSIKSVYDAYKMGLIDATLVGDDNIIKKLCKKIKIDHKLFKIVHVPDELRSGNKAVELIKKKKADILMKGLITSDNYIKCIIDKKNGLMKPKAVLAHVTIFEISTYHKLLLISDAAFIPLPTIQQKIAITNYLVDTAHNMGIKIPKVAILSFTEKSNPLFDSTADAAIIAKMGDRGQIKNAEIDGPLALDVAIDKDSVMVKGINSKVAGDADCLVFPQLEASNIFYKTLTKLIHAEAASYIAGTIAPCMLSSRGDSEKTKLYSIAVGCLLAQ